MVPDDGLELWGGIECTIARLGNAYRDQVGLTGHHERLADLDLVAALGIRTLRYPVLWEALSGEAAPQRGWAWHDARLERLRELGIRPIVGLVHHGSGPRDTSLLGADFATRLAAHGGEVARRYPWVDAYTPVNEPLTTARFSALYGHWYPHGRSYPEFLRALVNQCRAVDLAMRAIRQVNPVAELVQTEDFGRVFSSPAMAYQADHENERRWLTFDLLFGQVDRTHPWWRIFLDNGITAGELEALWRAVPPDVIGINYYLTSDRYLDEDTPSYPEHLRGNNGRHVYADSEAIRRPGLEGRTGIGARLREVAGRYQARIAVTEVHHGCTREEQLRWLAEIWHEAHAARREGVDVCAVTVWALFGACDWNSLLTRCDGVYEPGAFDVRGPAPRPTALAKAAESLARHGALQHPVLTGPGWWRRPGRYYRPVPSAREPHASAGPKLAIIGQPGPLRDECCRILDQRGLAWEILASDRDRMSTSDVWAVIDLGEAALAAGLAQRLDQAAATGAAYLLLSREGQAEEHVGCAEGHALVVSTGNLFGPGAPVPTVGRTILPRRDGGPDLAFSYVPDLVHVALDLLVDGADGAWRLVNPDAPDPSSLMPPLGSALARWAEASAHAADWSGMSLAAAG